MDVASELVFTLTQLNVVNGGSQQRATPQSGAEVQVSASAAHANIDKVDVTRTTVEQF